MDGVKLLRDGNIPGWIIEQILGMNLIRNNAKKSKHPQLKFPNRIKNLSPLKTRQQVLLYLKTYV